jgi:hypothetical protein
VAVKTSGGTIAQMVAAARADGIDLSNDGAAEEMSGMRDAAVVMSMVHASIVTLLGAPRAPAAFQLLARVATVSKPENLIGSRSEALRHLRKMNLATHPRKESRQRCEMLMHHIDTAVRSYSNDSAAASRAYASFEFEDPVAALRFSANDVLSVVSAWRVKRLHFRQLNALLRRAQLDPPSEKSLRKYWGLVQP